MAIRFQDSLRRSKATAMNARVVNVAILLKTCLATTHVEKWDPHVSPEAIRDTKVLRCTDSDSAFKYADESRPNVAWRMLPQTEWDGIARENTGEVVIQVAHTEGGSAFQSSTATSARIERIPRWF